MPLPDHRRINGPESSLDYKIFSAEDQVETELNKKRADGRLQTSNHRPICKLLLNTLKFGIICELCILVMRTGVASQAKGSAYIEQGNTKIVCGVYGPREIPKRSDFSMSGILFCHLVFNSNYYY